MQVANRYHLFIVLFMGTFLEDQQFSGPIPEELGKLEKLTVLATGKFLDQIHRCKFYKGI